VGAWSPHGKVSLSPVHSSPSPATLSLAGAWRVRLDPAHPGDTPPPEGAFADTIHLPATTETAGLGPLNPDHRADRLTAVRRIEGAVWYQREFVVPDAWRGRYVTLLLERTKWCQVWVDGRLVGEKALLCAPHEHRLGELAPGPHRLTLLVDNRRKPAPGDNHQTSEHTQGNWNGVLGRMELHATGTVWIEHVAIKPDLAANAFRLTVRLACADAASQCSYYEHSSTWDTADGARGNVRNTNIGLGEAGSFAGTVFAAAGDHRVSAPAAAEVTLVLPLGSGAARWDEFSPVLHRITVTLESPEGRDEREIVTGLREFGRRGTQFTINGRATFLRGEVNCCVFPLTGHPPMDVAGWRRYLGVLREHGLNHVRFHSWTPPDAAFTAADELGMYVATELPFWGEWTPAIADALAPEGEAILRAFGHHPSLVLLTLGNEHRGDRAARAGLVARLRALDPSRLYAQGANNDLETPALAPDDDCWITARLPAAGAPGRYVNVRGAHATPDRADGHLQAGAGGTRTDYRAAIAVSPVPVVSHEIGQYSSYPRFGEIARHTGVFAAHNLGHFRVRAEAAGLLARAGTFAEASTALAALCYREEIEAALRTPGFGGFELLGLQDFPGQGTALVGLYNAFLESKGVLGPAAFREFCGPAVVLARFDRHVWTAGEMFTADLELAHYGPTDFPAGAARWTLRLVAAVYDRRPDAERRSQSAATSNLASGVIAASGAAAGGLRPLGRLECVLPTDAGVGQLVLELTHEPSGATNRYPLWVFSGTPSTTPPGVTLARGFDAAARAALVAGGTVVVHADAGRPFPHTPGGGFTPDFWCWSMFKNVPGTLGLAIAAGHPALAGFPTASHADWQWFQLARAAQPVVLDGLSPELMPIVEVIDNPERAHRLGLIWEARVGPGRLLVCGIDLPALAASHPEARALLGSLVAYAASPAFAPKVALEAKALERVLGIPA
jgi:hypothetical protein